MEELLLLLVDEEEEQRKILEFISMIKKYNPNIPDEINIIYAFSEEGVMHFSSQLNIEVKMLKKSIEMAVAKKLICVVPGDNFFSVPFFRYHHLNYYLNKEFVESVLNSQHFVSGKYIKTGIITSNQGEEPNANRD